MRRAFKISVAVILIGGMAAAAQMAVANPIKHVVLVIQENRTPDNLFQALLSWPGINAANYDIASSGKNSLGQTIALVPESLGVPYDLSHAHFAFVAMYDGGKMDGANKVPCNGTCPVNPQFAYVDNSTGILNPYLTLAADYGWANAMFQTNQGASYPAHQFLFGGTSALSAAGDAAGVFVAENPLQPNGANYKAFNDTGCLAPTSEWNYLIQPTGKETKIVNTTPGTFCFVRPTMATLLTQAGLTWKYYAQGKTVNPGGTNPGGTIWTAPNSIWDICVPDAKFSNCTGAAWKANVDLNPADVLKDVMNCKLPNVSWVTPEGKSSDHAGSTGNTGGPSWVASIVNAIGTATTCDGGAGYWSDTAIIITWDDWGGWYDHVAPPILTGIFGDYEFGFRVPLLVVSAYTPQAYVNNEILDFGSVLRFVENTFSIPEGSLTFADARSTTDLHNFFDFKRPPRQFHQVAAPLDAFFFINDKRPPEPPDND